MTIIQLGSSINLVTYACTGVFTGWLLDRIAPRWIMIAGILATSAGLILAGSISTPLGLYLSYGVLVGAGSAGCGMVVTSVSIGKWFHRYRGLAIGISSMGIGVGTMLMAPFAGYLVKHYGWRNGFLFIGMFLLYHAKTVSVLYAYALVYGFGYGSLAPVMPYMIADRFGRQALGAAYGLGIFFATGLGGSVGPILGGYIYDKTGSYDLGWLICIVVLLIAAVTILTLKPKSARFQSDQIRQINCEEKILK